MPGAVKVMCTWEILGDGSNGALVLICDDGNLWRIEARMDVGSKIPKLTPALLVFVAKHYRKRNWKH